MSNGLYRKPISELEIKAVLWWPSFLSELESNASIIPLLIKTQDKFLSLLTLADQSPEHITKLIKSSSFPANLFVKHLVVLSDFGGEQIQRLNRQFNSIFPKNKSFNHTFKFIWHEKEYEYKFKKLPIRGNLDNKKLFIDGKSLSTEKELDELLEDMITILLYGSNCVNEGSANNLIKCEIGNLLGKKDELEKYVKEKYIWVSRITGGAQSNSLGQVAQTYVYDYLKSKLGNGYKITRNGSVKVTRSQIIPFDIVVEKDFKAVGIEVTFQVTTNSTIERKSGQAKSRQSLMHRNGNYIAYIIDGAGNFQRKSAISTICSHSDCTIAYSKSEFDVLVDFVKEVL